MRAEGAASTPGLHLTGGHRQRGLIQRKRGKRERLDARRGAYLATRESHSHDSEVLRIVQEFGLDHRGKGHSTHCAVFLDRDRGASMQVKQIVPQTNRKLLP